MMAVFLYVAAAAVFIYVTVYYGVCRGARCSSSVRLEGKTAIVTGNCNVSAATTDHLSSCQSFFILHFTLRKQKTHNETTFHKVTYSHNSRTINSDTLNHKAERIK